MEQIPSLRNATQAAKQFASSSAGQLARIEALVTVACLLVGILVLSNSRRRHQSHAVARLVVWGAFMFSYPVISYTIGLMQSSSVQNELFVVWACFLLLLLGSTDTMTAFSFNDSSKQTRSMTSQALHVAYLLSLLLYYKGQLRRNFLISLFVLWGLSIVKLGMRVKAYRSTSRSRGLVRENGVMYEYMRNEPLNSGGVGVRGRNHDPTTMQEYIYLVDGKEVKELTRGRQVIRVAYGAPETVNVTKIWQCNGKLLRLSSRDQGPSRRRDLCLSFALFRILRLRFAPNHVGDVVFPFQEDKFRDLVINGLLSDDHDLDRAFRVVEAELGFLFDFFYARYPSIKDTLAPDLIVYAVILATSMFTLFSSDLVNYHPTKGAANIFINGFNLDLLLTRLVIVWYIFLESYQFLAFFFSDWQKVKMICQYVQKESWHRAFVEIPVKVLCHFRFTKYWKETIGQYFILDNIHPHWAKSFLSWVSLEALDESLMTSSISLPPEVRQAVLRRLKSSNGKIDDGSRGIYDIAGRSDKQFHEECLLGHTYARYILIWHIVTSICDYGLSISTMEDASAELVKNHATATKLSGYCAYLLAFQPELIQDRTCTSLSLVQGTLKNAREFLADCKSNKSKYDKLIMLGRLGSTMEEVRFLSLGARIAVYLIDRIEDIEERWKALAVFWADMMLYIAPSNRAVAHATKMATGGEFITIIWALLTHAHVIEKLENSYIEALGLHFELGLSSA